MPRAKIARCAAIQRLRTSDEVRRPRRYYAAPVKLCRRAAVALAWFAGHARPLHLCQPCVDRELAGRDFEALEFLWTTPAQRDRLLELTAQERLPRRQRRARKAVANALRAPPWRDRLRFHALPRLARFRSPERPLALRLAA